MVSVVKPHLSWGTWGKHLGNWGISGRAVCGAARAQAEEHNAFHNVWVVNVSEKRF